MEKIVTYKGGNVQVNGRVRRKRSESLRKEDYDRLNYERQKRDYEPNTPHHKVTVIILPDKG